MAVHRLALRVAQTVAVVTGGAVGLAAGTGRRRSGRAWPPGVGLARPSPGAAAYLAVVRQIAGRLELARQTLRLARKRQFDALAALPGDGVPRRA